MQVSTNSFDLLYKEGGSTLRIYLAGSWDRREELKGYASQVMEAGYEVTSRWLLKDYVIGGKVDVQQEISTLAQPFALEDVTDIRRADGILCFSDSNKSVRGGRHVELGIAVALEKSIVLVGPKENVFHTLPNVIRWPVWDPARLHELANLQRDFLPLSPGQHFEAELEATGRTIEDLNVELISRFTLKNIIENRDPITFLDATLLESFTDVKAAMWRKIDTHYQTAKAVATMEGLI